MRAARAILLDYGHTIVDFVADERALLGAYEHIGQLIRDQLSGATPTAEQLLEQVSRRVAARLADSYERQDLQELDIIQEFSVALSGLRLDLPADLVRQVVALEHRALSATTFLPPGHGAVLQRLRSDGFRLGLVSNVSLVGQLVREDLDQLALLDVFDAIVLSSEIGVRKPHPRIYEQALAGLELPAHEVVFVGDRLREDVEGPQAQGMQAILTHQFRREVPGSGTAQPDAVIEQLSELGDTLQQLREAGR